MKSFEFARPTSLAEAAVHLAEKGVDARVIAGGTDLVTQIRKGILSPGRLVSLGDIPGLDAVEASAARLRLGPLVPLTRLASHPEIRSRWPALAEGAAAAASPQIRNAGTLGGNLCQRPRCWYFRSEAFDCRKKGGETCPAMEGENKYHAIFGDDVCRIVHPSDTAPALVAYDAEVAIRSARSERVVPIGSFFTMPSEDPLRENCLRPDELVAEVSVPAPPDGSRATYLKIREKESFDFALVSCAVVLTFEGETCRRARIVLGGVAPVPWRCREAESILEAHVLDDQRIRRAGDAAVSQAVPLSKNRYKVLMVKGALRRTLERLASEE